MANSSVNIGFGPGEKLTRKIWYSWNRNEALRIWKFLFGEIELFAIIYRADLECDDTGIHTPTCARHTKFDT